MSHEVLQVEVAGFKIAAFNAIDDVVANLLTSLDHPKVVVAMNPEKIMVARKDAKMRHILECADVRYPDGIGVAKIMERKLGRDVARIPGCELWVRIMEEAGQKGIDIFVLGATPSVLTRTIEKLQNEFSVNVVGSHHGYFENENELIDCIAKSKARIVTVALGSPRQEEFMIKCKSKNIKALMLGVGGTYDVYTGVKSRAPEWYLKNNLEWLYRLYKEPTRAGRQTRLIKYAVLAAFGRL
jgi:UDP-N-acetyl-D-mannosaminouronate:lipid I N-acetyl-D-mannosaminouronosyltransferase